MPSVGEYSAPGAGVFKASIQPPGYPSARLHPSTARFRYTWQNHYRPGMAALYLEPLDRRLEATGLTYVRFMDDWVILAPTRWSLRRAVRIVNETLRELRVEQHRDKTFKGWIKWGFTFLGYWISEKGVAGVAPSTWNAFQERVARLYEQNAPLEVIRRRVERYVRRWRRWPLGGVVVVGDAFRWPAAGALHLVCASTSARRSTLPTQPA